jgi:HPt (histidine-containing phosphotransfer) domain-containing protein
MDHEAHLREKAKLLLQRERELFEVRTKHEQMSIWLSLGQSLPKLFVNPGASLVQVCEGLRQLLVATLRLQRVLIVEVHSGALRPLAPAGPERLFAADAAALLESQPAGSCNEPREPAMLALAETLGLQRFMWSKISPPGRPCLLLAGGFDRNKARFQSPFVESDAAHFNNAAQHIQSLLANALLVDELRQERDQLRRTNLTLEHRDRELQLATEQLRAANEGLEQRVRERTQELAAKNRDLRLVLDNVDQALMTIDLDGRLAPERSTVVDQWFGPYAGRAPFFEYVAEDRKFAEAFLNGLDTLRDGILPLDVCLQQMPKRLVVNQRQFECRYLPISEGEELKGLLLVVDDMTERLARLQEELEQRELLAAFMALTRDRTGFLAFFDESERMLADLSGDSRDDLSVKQILHTLKGNASVFGLNALAGLCEQAESEIEVDGRLHARTLERLRARWKSIAHTLRAVVSGDIQNSIEVSERDLACLAECAQRGASGSQIVSDLRRLRWELVERSLRRLGQHAEVLARRLGKGEIEILVDADQVRLDPERWAPLWSALVHIVRNAVDHGLESPQRRFESGKRSRGTLRLAAHVANSNLHIEIEDDGQGIDWDAVRQLCQERGRPSGTRKDLVDAVLAPDFSTRKEATELSGRGIGVAAVAAVVRELEGTLAMASEPFQGTCWSLTLPIDAAEASVRYAGVRQDAK